MKLVILKTFESAFDAHLIKGKLKSEGIESFLFDEHTVSVNPLYNITVGGIKLKVNAADYDKALEILNESKNTPFTDENELEIKCPNCNSTELYAGFNSIKSFKAILATIISILLMSYPIYYNSVYRCKKCDTEFKHEK